MIQIWLKNKHGCCCAVVVRAREASATYRVSQKSWIQVCEESYTMNAWRTLEFQKKITKIVDDLNFLRKFVCSSILYNVWSLRFHLKKDLSHCKVQTVTSVCLLHLRMHHRTGLTSRMQQQQQQEASTPSLHPRPRRKGNAAPDWIGGFLGDGKIASAPALSQSSSSDLFAKKTI
jgi:hypothetical protein